jgi:hypothetical protein
MPNQIEGFQRLANINYRIMTDLTHIYIILEITTTIQEGKILTVSEQRKRFSVCSGAVVSLGKYQ